MDKDFDGYIWLEGDYNIKKELAKYFSYTLDNSYILVFNEKKNDYYIKKGKKHFPFTFSIDEEDCILFIYWKNKKVFEAIYHYRIKFLRKKEKEKKELKKELRQIFKKIINGSDDIIYKNETEKCDWRVGYHPFSFLCEKIEFYIGLNHNIKHAKKHIKYMEKKIKKEVKNGQRF